MAVLVWKCQGTIQCSSNIHAITLKLGEQMVTYRLFFKKSSPENPSTDEMIACEKYVSGYACKGSEPTGAIADIFNDLSNSFENTSSGTSTKTVVTKLLMHTIKKGYFSSGSSF